VGAVDLNTWVLLFVAVANAITGYMAWRTHTRMDAVVTAVEVQANDIHTIEKATNSMKDALVTATGQAALAEGREIGRAEGAAKASALAEGRLTAQEELPKP
jgi:hypothetical protein